MQKLKPAKQSKRTAEATGRKTRVAEKTFLTKKEAEELADFMNGDWFEPKPPAAVKNWRVLLDDEVESIQLNAPVIDLKKFKTAVDSTDWGQAIDHEMRVRNPVTNAVETVETLLVLFKGFKGHYEKHAGGLINRDSIEACTMIPDRMRKKLFLLLPKCVNAQQK